MEDNKKTVSLNKLGIVLFSKSMFQATGESDKPFIVLDLTHEQQKKIAEKYSKGYSILSIHLYEK